MSFFWFLVLSVAVFSLGFWLTQRLQNKSSRRQDFSTMAPRSAVPLAASDSAHNREHLERQVQNLLAQGQQIEAIKLVRQKTNWGLKEARDYVNQLARQQPSGLSPGTVQSPLPLPTSVQLKVQQLLANGQKIAAIKLVRQSTGWSLSAAKDYVEQLSRS
jgi:ribosomal protein L7/L12